MINRPLNLLVDDSYNYLLEKKKSFRAQTSELYFNDKIPSEKTDFNALIERYSDKYIKQKKIVDKSWIPGLFDLFRKTSAYLSSLIIFE